MIRPSLLPVGVGAAFAAIAAAVWASVPPQDWKLAGPFGGTATTVALDPENPGVLLAGGRDSLLYQSQDSGENWNLVAFPKRHMGEVTSILVDPADAKHYLVGTIAAESGGLYESHDRGKTWTSVKDIRDFGVRALAASTSQPSRFVAGTLRGVMLSDDSGKTWVRISDPNNLEMQGITAVAIDTRDPSVIYAGTTHLPWKTSDGGKTWESIHDGMIDDSDVFSIYIDPVTPTSILASACSGIYASENRGDLWHKLLGIPNTSRRTHVVREDPSNPSTIFAGTTTGLFKSMNHGMTWKTLTNTQVNALAFDPSRPGNMYLALEYEGLGRSRDDGEAIDPINKGFVDRVISSVTVSGDRLLALETSEGETSGLFVSGDRGESWSQLHNIRGLSGVHLKAITGVPAADRILLASSSHLMYKSVDSGLTWKQLAIRLVIPPPAEPARPATQGASRYSQRVRPGTTRARLTRPVKPRAVIKEVSPSEISALYSAKRGGSQLVFAATDLGLLQSADAGEHWTLCQIPGSVAVTALYLSPDSSGYLIARTAAGLFASKDYGDHWDALAFPLPPSDINEIAVPADPASPLLVATRVGLYSSSDGGEKWSIPQTGLPASTVNSVVYTGQEKTAYAVEYGQLYFTRDAGLSWSSLPTSVSELRIRQLWIPDRSSDRLYGITSDLGILFRE